MLKCRLSVHHRQEKRSAGEWPGMATDPREPKLVIGTRNIASLEGKEPELVREV